MGRSEDRPLAKDGSPLPLTADEVREGTILAVGVSSVVLDDVAPHAGEAVASIVREETAASTGGAEPEIVRRIARARGRNVRHDALGHTLLLDYDDGASYLDVQREARDLDGITALLESSPGGYHVWNLSVASLDERLIDALHTRTDPMHVQQSAKRGRFILRCSPKWRVDDRARPIERYKDAPEVLDCWVTPTERPQSRPHLQLLGALAERDDRDLDLDRRDLDLVGDRLIRSDYLTLDDGTKRRVRT